MTDARALLLLIEIFGPIRVLETTAAVRNECEALAREMVSDG